MRRIVISILGLAVIGIAVVGILYGPQTYAGMQVGVGYVAHHMCACQHIAGRGQTACRADIPPVMSSIDIQAMDDRLGAKATLFGGLVQRIAVYSNGAGCTLQ